MDGAGPQAEFPLMTFPADESAQRLAGVYPQNQEGRWMQRVKVLGGALQAAEWQVLADVARHQSPATPLHLTTRQNVELHDLTPEAVLHAQRRLAEGGLTGRGAGGDTLRNITVCPCSGTAGRPDLAPLAVEVRRTLEATDGIFALPRKFKISFSACAEGCGQPWINDLGFVARRDGDRRGFEVVAGGSLGARPGTAMRIFEFLPAADVGPCALAAVRVFMARGDRANRARARLRHVRERIGDAPFAVILRDAVVRAKAERPWPDVPWAEGPATLVARRTLTFPHGDVTAVEAEALAALAQQTPLAVRIANHHRVIVWGPSAAVVDAAVAALPALARARTPQPAIVACPGRRWCRRGLTDTRALADRLRAAAGGVLSPEITVAISGCLNGCAQSAVADVGLIGVRAAGQEAYHLFVGGGMGRTDHLAEPAGHGLVSDEVVARIVAGAMGAA